MARVRPFRGLRYNLEKIGDMEKVVTPPYDVISPGQQDQFYGKSPFNVVRLDFGKIAASDGEADNRYTRAAEAFKTWQREEVLLRDRRPAMYLYHVTYTLPGNRVFTRKGLLALVRCEEFSTGIVKPHEKTFPKVTSDRLQLMEHCAAHFSPVFSLYSDQRKRVASVLDEHKDNPPLVSFHDWEGLKHELWAVTDERAIAQAQQILDTEPLFIADGHHRYTTGLQYAREMRSRYPEAPEDSSFNHIMMYLCGMEDEGLVVLPTHRLLTSERPLLRQGFIDEASKYFDLESVSLVQDQGKRAEEGLRP